MYTFVQQIQSWYIERIKSIEHKSSRYESKKIKKYICEYEADIEKILNKLKNDPDNNQLKLQLQDKIYRKKQFEEDIKIIYFDKDGNHLN